MSMICLSINGIFASYFSTVVNKELYEPIKCIIKDDMGINTWPSHRHVGYIRDHCQNVYITNTFKGNYYTLSSVSSNEDLRFSSHKKR